MNPYDFVRLPNRVLRGNVLTHHRFSGRSGSIRCRLTAITPIFIPHAQATGGVQRFMTARYRGQDVPIIPGSSLKGVIRSVAEAVSFSCIGLSGELFEHGKVSAKYQGKIARDFVTCNQAAKLCPACRLFGMVSRESHFLGKVSFSDAQSLHHRAGSPMILKPLMEPKPRHSAFYQPNEKIAGRKFYFHHARPPKTASQATGFTKTVIPLEGLGEHSQPQTVFEFDAEFFNLTDEEYSLLLFALALNEDLRHKIGSGKPLGLGTVQIEIIEIRETDVSRRYRGLGQRATDTQIYESWTGERLRPYLQSLTGSYTSEPSPSVNDLQRIWKYPPATDVRGGAVDYAYPDQNWFDKNPNTPISNT